jgi:hypothetical protein
MAAEDELRLDPGLERRPPPLLQARDLALGKRLIRKVGKRRAPPEVKRPPQRLGRALGIGAHLGPAARHKVLEAVNVPLPRTDVQPVRAPMGLEPPISTQRLPQGRHLVVQHLMGRRRRRLTP